jgi:hypothetical protein
MARVQELCGITNAAAKRSDPVGYRGWPDVACTLEPGHESKHEHRCPDDVSWIWPHMPSDIGDARAPGRAFYRLCTRELAPWFTQWPKGR